MTRRAALVTLALLLAASVGTMLWMRSRARVHPDSVTLPVDPARRGRPVRDPATIPAMLRDSSWQTRLGAAHALRTMSALSVPRRAVLLAEALDREAGAPVSGPPFTGSYLPLRSMVRLQYLAVLESLGEPATGAVRGASAPATSAGREWRALAVSATGDKSSAPRLRELLASADPAVRMTAARYLGYLEDGAAIPALQRALADPFAGTSVSDMPQGSGIGTPGGFHPVREQAARALRVLGVKVERQGETYTVQLPP